MALHAAIQWRWPGAQCVVRGTGGSAVLERWDGPMARPTDAEIAQAVTDYATQGIATKAERDRQLSVKAMRALATAIHKRLKATLPTDATTAAEWEAAIRAEWDAL